MYLQKRMYMTSVTATGFRANIKHYMDLVIKKVNFNQTYGKEQVPDYRGERLPPCQQEGLERGGDCISGRGYS